MFISETLSVNAKNLLTIGGADIEILAEKYKTPLYLMDEKLIKQNCLRYMAALKKYYGENSCAFYASKAFCAKYMYKLLSEAGMGADVVSGGELYTALSGGMAPNRIYFHGSNKTTDEIEFALESNINRFVVDNIYELETLNSLAYAKGKTANISFRLKPGIDAHTHEFTMTGSSNSKFGISLENNDALNAVERAISLPNINLSGVHCHIGSQIFELEPYRVASKRLVSFIALVYNKLNYKITEINLGGGFGIKISEQDDPNTIEENVRVIAESVKAEIARHNLHALFLAIEPGRSIVSSAGITVYTVGNLKSKDNESTFLSVDGGMTDNPRPALYNAQYTSLPVKNPCGERVKNYTIVGRCCESDVLIKTILMPEVKTGDLIAFLSTGAYNYSMAMNYNRVPRLPVVMVNNSEDKLIIKRETYDDLIKNDL